MGVIEVLAVHPYQYTMEVTSPRLMHKPEWFWWICSHCFIIFLKTNKKGLWHENSATMSFFLFFFFTQVSLLTALYSWICRMLHEISYQNINIYVISGQNGLQSYCDTSCSRDGVTQMWILKNSKDLFVHIQSRSLFSCNSIKTFNLSALCTIIPYSKLNDILRELVQLCFTKKNGQRRYKYQRYISYFVRKNQTTLIQSKSSLKLISSKCSRFWLTTYLLCLVDVFFNRQPVSLWIQTVLLFALLPLFAWGRLHTGAS